ncbi:MAG TPA: hypothetical protein PKA63_07285 [Oligoflexia bacterium]|nr:hypothetical protein [Oligoflexia bacterium]HMP48452.1 hypothetical protein [Oligoflexia bacterium]
MSSKFVRFFNLVILNFLLVFSISACGSSADNSYQARIINGTKGLSAITAKFNDEVFFEELSYTEGTSFFKVPALASLLRIGSPDLALPLLEAEIKAEKDQYRTFVVLKGTDDGPRFRIVDFTEEYKRPFSGEVSLQIINASTLDESVDVYVVLPDTRSISSLDPAVKKVAVGKKSNAFSLSEGTYIIIYTESETKSALWKSREITLKSGTAYTHLLFDGAQKQDKFTGGLFEDRTF